MPCINLVETAGGTNEKKKYVKKLILTDEQAELFKNSFNVGVIQVEASKKGKVSANWKHRRSGYSKIVVIVFGASNNFNA